MLEKISLAAALSLLALQAIAEQIPGSTTFTGTIDTIGASSRVQTTQGAVDDMWITMSSSPQDWIRVRTTSTASALLGAARQANFNFGGTSFDFRVETILSNRPGIYNLGSVVVQAVNNPVGTVASINAASQGAPHPLGKGFTSLVIAGVGGFIANSADVAHIATVSLMNKLPLTVETTNVYVFNAATGGFESVEIISWAQIGTAN